MHLETIAQMSCNPAIGGLAKGHLVREIDALGGIMGLLADETGIHFRLLNRSRGAAVQAPRAQCDKARYRLAMKERLEEIPGLTILSGHCDRISSSGKIEPRGVLRRRTPSSRARAVILTPGTFLNGLIHIGLSSYPAGRANEPPSVELATAIEEARLENVPPENRARRCAWTGTRSTGQRFAPQPGDDDPVPFSFRTERQAREQGPLSSRIYERQNPRRDPPKPRQVSPLRRAGSRASGRGTARRSRTRSSSSPIIRGTSSFSSPKGSRRRRSTSTGFPPAFRSRSSARSCGRFPAWRRPKSCGRPTRSNTMRSLRPSCFRRSRPGDHRGPLPGRADQRDLGLRGGRRPGAHGRNQRRPEDPEKEALRPRGATKRISAS